ncbi:MAG: FAD binding domain-containing protein [Anaerolineae bacterium]
MLRNINAYHKPTTIEEAVALVQTNTHAAYLGGGAWLTAHADVSPEVVVDLQNMGLDRVEGDIEAVRIGAMVTLQQLIDQEGVGKLAGGVLAQAARLTQSRNLREQGTLGGTLVVAGPADPLTTVLLVLDSEIFYADPASHSAPFASFVAYRDRLIKARALITEVRVKRPPVCSAAAYEVVGRSPKDKPIVGAAAYVEIEEGLAATVRLAVGGADETPVRLLKAEHLLKDTLLGQTDLDAALQPALEQLHPSGDFRGSSEYRLEMAKVLSRRALLSAWERARRGRSA